MLACAAALLCPVAAACGAVAPPTKLSPSNRLASAQGPPGRGFTTRFVCGGFAHMEGSARRGSACCFLGEERTQNGLGSGRLEHTLCCRLQLLLELVNSPGECKTSTLIL